MSTRIKVLFLINSLGGGGAERVLVNLVNHMDTTKFNVTVQTMFSAGVNKEYLHKDIHFIETNAPYFKGISRLIKQLPPTLLYRYFIKDQYDVLIAYMHGAPTRILWGAKCDKAAKIAWLHCDMARSSLGKFFTKKQIPIAFGSFDKIVGCADTVSKSFVDLYGLEDRVLTRYNTNDTKRIRELSNESIHDRDMADNRIKLVTVGRLHEQKGYDRLIRICKKLKNDGLSYHLLILGQGQEENTLRNLIEQEQVYDCVELGGFVKNPYPYIKSADLFVSSSRYEGLSTVISEAIILGIPVISTDVSGAKEVLGENNEYGLVVENDDNALYKGMKKLISDPSLLAHYRAKAAERSDFFETSRTVRAVEELIEEVVRL